MSAYDIQDAVMQLHNIARLIEREFGYAGELSNELRSCADRLAMLTEDKNELHRL